MNNRVSWAFLGLLVVGLCLCICLVPMLIGSPIGRMSFTSLESVQGYQTIEGTDFAVERRAGRRERDVYLIHLPTGEERRISNTFSESSIAIVPWNGKVFLINETNGGGTDGWIYYSIFDVSGSQPEQRGTFQGCARPRQLRNYLIFDYASKCDTYPYLTAIQFDTFILE